MSETAYHKTTDGIRLSLLEIWHLLTDWHSVSQSGNADCSIFWNGVSKISWVECRQFFSLPSPLITSLIIFWFNLTGSAFAPLYLFLNQPLKEKKNHELRRLAKHGQCPCRRLVKVRGVVKQGCNESSKNTFVLYFCWLLYFYLGICDKVFPFKANLLRELTFVDITPCQLMTRI